MCVIVSFFREFLRDFMQLLRLQYGKYMYVYIRCSCVVERVGEGEWREREWKGGFFHYLVHTVHDI